MHFIGILAFCCFSALTAHELNHGKIVSCSVLSQSALDMERLIFNYSDADWQYCTHVMVMNTEFQFEIGTY